jgi:hypothetical protein
MGSPFRYWGKGAETYRRFVMQKKLMYQYFPDFRCSLARRQLTCIGEITPAEGCDTYTLKIQCGAGEIPKVWILAPKIVANSETHVYADGSLCLYYPLESPWRPTDNIHEKLVPWTAEWLVFYELYLISGVWLGKSAPHPIPPSRSIFSREG